MRFDLSNRSIIEDQNGSVAIPRRVVPLGLGERRDNVVIVPNRVIPQEGEPNLRWMPERKAFNFEENHLVASSFWIKNRKNNLKSENEFLHSLIKEVRLVKKEFDELSIRQICFSEIKEKIPKLWDNFDENDSYHDELLIIIERATQSMHSEDLNIEYISLLEDALSYVEKTDINEEDVEEIGEKFMECGLSITSRISGLSELY
ncbi:MULTISPECIES: hypothetical protein [Methanobacterium]|uniref:Uncharacterized protein n=1 Tax=Methanobacterium bryantii TaxID=2161 RepID=A0A2A2H6X5_METBR|nr:MULTISPECIES: hypothetical protein [Methanobacterium]OEC85815.1 hypothetical protein A9507_12275 [Methanobacterium sp. A39]PAV05030.1 hypothetical protein ASJ80_12060 [Methanobacterium bryantii]